jgi:Formamidopyrimidine-DNA glycosylase N-terminal domain
VPELLEAERARREIDRVLGRDIVAVDESDTYVCRPHAPGEIAAALVGHRLTATHRRGKLVWAETDDDGPQLGLHLGIAGQIAVDEPLSSRHWDRFVLGFADGGQLALRDKLRLGRAILAPDLSHLGPDAAEVDRGTFRTRVGRGTAPLRRGCSTSARSPGSATCSPTRSCGAPASIPAGRPVASQPRSWTGFAAPCTPPRVTRSARAAHNRPHHLPP